MLNGNMFQQAQKKEALNASVRQLREKDLPEADRICRLAYGTFFGLPDPMTWGGDTDYVRTRWLTDPTAAFGAEVNGELVGSNFVTRWGSVGFFGPLTVRPDLWDRGIAKRLLERTMEVFADWGTKHVGLFTLPNSEKHVGLYQKFGFWPRFLTPIMSKLVEKPEASQWTKYSDSSENERAECLETCRNLTNAIYKGLDVKREIRAVETQQLGETILQWNQEQLVGFAVCHVGAGSEAGSENCYVKFGAVRPGANAPRNFERLLDACEVFAAARGIAHITAGMNTARHEAYRIMMRHGFRAVFQGVVMQKPNEPGYNQPDVYLIDDWR